MAEQLAFSLPARAALGRQDFLVAPPNETALMAIEDWRNWPGRKLILLGPEASGKTHLTQVWASLADANVLDASQIAATLTRRLEPETRIAVEDADKITDPDQQLRLLGLHNLLQETGGWLLLTATRASGDWPLTLPDLRSRVQAAGVARLENPDDTLLAGVLLKLFEDRQLQIDPAVVTYISRRIERSFAAAQRAVETVDRNALAEKRAITRPFVAEIFGKGGN